MRQFELTEILKGAADAALVVGLDGAIRYSNRAAEQLFQLSAKEMLGRHCASVVDGVGSGGERICSPSCPALELAREDVCSPSFDLQVKRKDPPGRRWVNLSTLVAFDGSSRVVVHLARDIDGRKRLESVTRHFLDEVCALTGQQVEQLLSSPAAPHLELTERERQVLELLSRGENTRAIAAKLEISTATARNHIQHLLEKLHAHSRTEAVLRSVRERLI